MSDVIVKPQISPEELALVTGDLSKLTSEQRLSFYNRVCTSLGLNALTKPFEYVNLKGKLVFYATKNCAEQLRNIHGVSITKIEKETTDNLLTVTVYAKDKSGKEDSDIGALDISGMKGEALANGVMKCVTKAKRRVTLSICGLGMLDETEVEAASGRDVQLERAKAIEARIEPKPETIEAKPESTQPESLQNYIFRTGTERKGKFLHEFDLDDLDASLQKYQADKLAGKVYNSDVDKDFAVVRDYLSTL